jgi:hypothetical protein
LIIESFLLSILIGFIRRGSLRNLGRVPMRHLYLFALPILMLAVATVLVYANGSDRLIPYVRAINVLQYVTLTAAVAVNFRLTGMPVIWLGTFLNTLVITVNGGVMPTSAEALKVAGLGDMLESGQTWARHALIGQETRLSFIADIVPIKGFAVVQPQVVSMGDLLIAVGVFILVQRYMCKSAPEVEPQHVTEDAANQ